MLSREQVESLRRSAKTTRRNYRKKTEERVDLPVKGLIRYCDNVIDLCNMLLKGQTLDR